MEGFSCRAIQSSSAYFIAVQFMLLGIHSFVYHVPHAEHGQGDKAMILPMMCYLL